MRIGLRREKWICVWVTLIAAIAFGVSGCSRESRKAKYLERANQYFAGGDYTKAEIEYLNVLRLDAADPTAILNLGNLYYEQGNLPKAFAFLKRSAELKSGDVNLRIKLGRIYLTGRKYKEARDESWAALQQQPDLDDGLILYSQACITTNDIKTGLQQLESLRSRAETKAGFHLAMGTLAFRQQNLKAAEESFGRALQIDPKSSPANELMGNLQFRLNNVAKGGELLKTAAELAPVRSVTRLRYSDYLKDAGDEKGALAVAEDVVKRAPDYIPGNVHLAQMLASARRFDEAQELVKRVLNMDPANYDAILLNGRLLLATKDLAKGVAELEKLARGYSQSAQAHYNLALGYLGNGEAAKAFNSVSQAVALDGNYADAVLLHADLGIQKGDAAGVIGELTQLVRTQPQIGRAYVLLGDAHLARRNYPEAMATYRRLSELFPKNPIAHQLMGGTLLREGKRAEARKAFEKAGQLAPDYQPAFEQLVLLDIAEKDYPAAMARIQQEMQKRPTNAAPHVLTAAVHSAQTNLTQAEVSLNKAIELDPGNRTALMMLSRLYIQSGRKKQALTRLEGVAEKNPKDSWAFMQIGMLQGEQGDHAAARKSYEQVLKSQPDNVAALNNLAVLYSERFSMPDQALEMARRARELSPRDPYTADTLGWILYQRGEYSRALPLLQSSSENLPDEPEVWYHLGMTQYMLGNEAAARTALTRATAAAKSYNGREEANRRIQLLNLAADNADAGAVAQLEKHFSEHPGDPIVGLRLATIEERRGAYDKAVSIYERISTQNLGNITVLSRAAKLYAERLNNPKRALELAKRARELSPEDPELAHTLGSIAFETGDQPWAVSLLEESSRKLSENPDVLYDLALAQYSVGRVADAENTMNRALSSGKPFSRSEAGKRWLTLSSLYADPARLRQSAATLGDWLKAEPSNVPVLMATGVLHELQTNAAAAQQTYDRVLALYPGFTPATVRLARLYADQPSQLQKSYDLLSKLRQTLPNDAEVAKTLGIVSHRRGDHSRAVALLVESSRKLPSDAQVYYYLGLAHQQLKQKSESKQALEKALSLNPDASTGAEIRRVLGELK